MESVSDVRYEERAVIEFLFAEKESERNIHNICGSAMVDRSTIVHWAKRVTASKQEKLSSVICAVTTGYMRRTSHTHLFLVSARSQKWTETFWISRVWTQNITLHYV
jgi:hypothetical protein